MEPIRAKSYDSQVAFRIREMIRQGVLSKGEKIKEADLCDKIGVSRTPVREALRTLSSEGLIDLVPQKGAFVSEPPIERVKEMLDLMALLEGEAARIAVNKMTAGELDKIKAMHDELEANYENKDIEGYIQANFRYHRYIQELTGNEVLSEVIDSLRDKVSLYRSRQLHIKGRFKKSLQEHRDLMSAFESRDVKKAETLMKKHLNNQCAALIKLFSPAEKNPIK